MSIDTLGSGTGSPTTTAKVVAKQASVEYVTKERRTLALSAVDMSIAEGEFVAIVGPSGSGKTTFLMALAGLVQLTSGSIAVNGAEVSGPGRDRAVVFQDASLLPWRTVIDNVSYGLDLEGTRSKAERKRICMDLLGITQLAPFADYYPRQLSGGMQQRANIARALAVDPDVLLLDEPLAALDAQTRETMQGELLRIWEQRQKTALIVTHQIDEAIFLADRVFVFGPRPARVLMEITIPFGRPRPLELKQSPEFHEIYHQIWELIRSTE